MNRARSQDLVRWLPIVWLVADSGLVFAIQPVEIPRCQLIPQAGDQVAFQVDGVEQARWHFGRSYPRPFLYPLNGPSGTSLTRMGHPGAPNHDHHRSIWLAHQNVAGLDFWSDQMDARIHQKHWYCYHDENAESIMACALGWYDGRGVERMHQDLIIALRPLEHGEYLLEFQITSRPPSGSESVALGKTNFGLLAVRVAKSISVHFGGGALINSELDEGEQAIFGKPARWVDYSGPVPEGSGPSRRTVIEGITYFDHPANPRYPARWHVRADGWMGASLCMQDGLFISAASPLTLRYLLYVHRGGHDTTRAQTIHAAFSQRPGFSLAKSSQPHQQFEVRRMAVRGTKE